MGVLPEASLLMSCFIFYQRQFYRSSGYIWTYNGTAADKGVHCKVDRTRFGTDEHVVFTRTYYKCNKKYCHLLEGTLAREANAMYVRNKATCTVTYEQVVFMDSQCTCGVFYTANIGNVQDQRTICELRVKAFHRYPEPSEECLCAFTQHCPIRPYFGVYNRSCPQP
ncbi:uncharacterized protein LOC144142210 [Haemaphysalis longicornis]